MTRMRYAFVQSASAVYGQIQNEIDDVSNAAISSFVQSTHTETRGDGPSSQYFYNGYLLEHEQDYENVQNSYGYDGNSYLASIQNRNGHTASFTREPYAGKKTAISCTDTNGQLLTTLIDYGSTAQVPNPVNPYWVMKMTDPRGHATTFTRDGNHQLAQITYPDGTCETFAYNNFGQPTYHQATDGSGHAWAYDGSGNLVWYSDSINYPANRFINYYHDSVGRVSQVTDFNGHNTWFTYNGRHLVTQIKHDDNTHQDFGYDAYGNRTTVSDELQHVTTTTYDNHRRPTSIKVPINTSAGTYRTTLLSYDRPGDATGDAHTKRTFGTVTLPSGKKMHRVYNGNGWLVKETRGYNTPTALTDTYTYDKIGNPLLVYDANNVVQATYTYDVLERKQTLTDANAHVTTWAYYPAGNPNAGLAKSVQRPGSSVGTFATTNYTAYDIMGRLQATSDASNHTTGHAYDACGRLSSVSDANGSYVYGYDALSRVTSLTFPDSTTKAWTYDPVGNPVTYTTRAGQVKTLYYDGRDRPYFASWSGNAAPATAWTFDAANRLTELDNWWAGLHYSYEDSGLPMSEQNTNYLANSAVNTTGYTRDADGNIAAIQYPAGDVASFAYDEENRCVGLGTLPNNLWSHLYFYGEQVTSRVLANNVTTQYFLQANGRPYEVWQHHGGDDPNGASWPASNISARPCGYAPNGQLTWVDRQSDGGNYAGSALENDHGENFGYAADGSLNAFGILCGNTYQNADSNGDSGANPGNIAPGTAVGAGGPGSYVNTYSYDAAGNRASVTQMG